MLLFYLEKFPTVTYGMVYLYVTINANNTRLMKGWWN